jgi:hypothetical protein
LALLYWRALKDAIAWTVRTIWRLADNVPLVPP